MTSTSSSAKFGIQITASCVSLIASSTMSFILIRSPTKGLNSPYRRIIFCLSCSDILQSFTGILGPLAIPRGTAASIAPFAMGNRATCAANGFVASNAINFAGMYTCSLCIYYVCKLQWRMSDDKFRARVEWVLHLSVFLVNLPLTLTALALDTYHTTEWGGCHYHGTNLECIDGTNLQGGECDVEHDDMPWTFLFIGGVLIPGVNFLVIIYCAVLLSRHAILKRREIESNKTDDDETKKIMNLQDVKTDNTTSSSANKVSAPRALRKKTSNMRESEQSAATNLQVLSRLYRKETLTQALLFVISFTIIYIMVPFVAIIGGLAGSSLGGVQFAFAFLFPLGGLFNILVYCRPKVAALKRREDGQGKPISWIKGFVRVVLAGGEIPTEENEEHHFLRSEFTRHIIPTPRPSQLPYGHSLERNSIGEWLDNAFRGDRLDWFCGDYYIEEDAMDEITHLYAQHFDPDRISGALPMSFEEEKQLP